MNQTQSLMTVPQFAERLRVTPACIRRWILERRITTIKVGRCVRIQPEEVDRIIAAGLRPARSAKPGGRESR
jgi:excisionase family DNA binding protein